MRLLMFWLLLCSCVLCTSATQMMCNAAKCTSYTNELLERNVTVSEPINVVIINGSVPANSGCSVQLDFEDSYYIANVIWRLSHSTEVTSTMPLIKGDLSIINPYESDNVENNRNIVTINFKITEETFIDHIISFGKIESINFTADAEKFKNDIWDMLKNSQTNNFSTSGCSDDLTVSLCPCEEPVITPLHLVDGVLTCKAVSLHGIDMSITRNGTELPSADVDISSGVFGTLTLQNVTVSESTDVTYTCTVTNDAGGNVSRNYTVTTADHNEEHSTEVEDHEHKIILFVAVGIGSILAVVGSCFGVIKCVEKIAASKHTVLPNEEPVDEVRPDEARSAFSGADIAAMVGGIESNYSDVKFVREAGEEEEEAEEPNIYNHLDPTTRTFARNDFRTLNRQPPTTLPPQPPPPPKCNTRFSPPAEDHYEMQTLSLSKL